ncbi:MAG: SOS response-associated peptidase [Bifidobacteriaceae bacterium]|jgi:putative SOS response-associated peptidase YedK|nr:SOS response-associated peptidase [Bifidobacteriaceae bacterium]
MCGRYANYHSTDAVVRAFGIDRIAESFEPSWNIAPTQRVAIIRDDDGPHPPQDGVASVARLRELGVARWGLVPSWAKVLADAPLLINARSETVTTKPAFRAAASRRRTIVPASGYYEWQAQGRGPKTPFFLAPQDGAAIGFAGLYEWWRPASAAGTPEGEDGQDWLCSVAIITRAANDTLGHIHDRMPVVVPQDLVDAWLDPTLTDRGEVGALVGAMPPPALVPREVSREVNSVRHNSAALIRPVGPQGEQMRSSTEG